MTSSSMARVLRLYRLCSETRPKVLRLLAASLAATMFQAAKLELPT